MPLQSHLTSYQQADLHCTKSDASHRGPHNRDIRVLVTDILSSSPKGGHSSPTNVRYRGILFCAPIVDKRNKHLIALSADAMLGWSDWGPSLFERRDAKVRFAASLHCLFDSPTIAVQENGTYGGTKAK